MRVCIYGLGAIGGLIAARLARSGQPVSAVVRGPALEALRRDGLTLLERDAESAGAGPGAGQSTGAGAGDGTGAGERRTVVPVIASDRPADLGQQDLVILAVKTTALPQVAAAIAPLLGRDTAVLSAMNGVPWWFFHGLDPRLAAVRLDSVDAGGALASAIPPARVIGCVTHLSSAAVGPAIVRHGAGERLIVGEPAGGADTDRCRAAAALLERAGFQVERAARIQQDIWFKLWGNMTINPVSALTGATADRILDDPLLREYLSRCMLEAASIGERIGLPIPTTPEERHAVTRKLGALRTSMLQDVEAHRPIELDALVGAVAEIGRAVAVPTPNIDALLGLTRVFARQRGLYPG
jgi:2-dehydropantoate 2-reductase